MSIRSPELEGLLPEERIERLRRIRRMRRLAAGVVILIAIALFAMPLVGELFFLTWEPGVGVLVLLIGGLLFVRSESACPRCGRRAFRILGTHLPHIPAACRHCGLDLSGRFAPTIEPPREV